MSAAFLAAGAGDAFEVVIVVIILLVATVVRLLGQARTLKPPQGLPRPPADRGVQQQIDEFLRRAAERRGADGPAAGSPPAPKPEPVVAEAVPDEPVGGRLLRRVQEDLDTSDFRRRGAQMGEEVTQSDKDFQQGVGKAFSGEVGRLAKRPGETAVPTQAVGEPAAVQITDTDTAAEDEQEAAPVLASLLSSPDSLVAAIILSEILRQPEWEA
jgi:hypothetical protein